MHLTPAGLPLGIPGIELDMLMAIQHAPQDSLHSIRSLLAVLELVFCYTKLFFQFVILFPFLT